MGITNSYPRSLSLLGVQCVYPRRTLVGAGAIWQIGMLTIDEGGETEKERLSSTRARVVNGEKQRVRPRKAPLRALRSLSLFIVLSARNLGAPGP